MPPYIIVVEAMRFKKEWRMVKIQPVRLMKRGHNFQIYYYNLKGERRRLSVGNDEQNAHRMVVKFNDWLLESKDPEREMVLTQQAEQSCKITLRELFKEFFERHGSKQSTSMQNLYRERFKNIVRCPQLADIPIEDISKRLMLDYMNARMKHEGVSSATVNREAAMVKCMLSRANEWDIIKHNPLQGLRLLPEAEKRKVELSPEKAAELINTLPDSLASIVEFAIYSGFRRENILGLRIEPILFHDSGQTGEVELVVKGGRREKFPLGPLAVEVLKRIIRQRTEGYVFLNPSTDTRYHSIHKSFDRAVRKLNLTVNGTKLRFHDLRHVFATWLLRAGVSLDVLRELLGHKERSTTDRYATYNRLDAGQYLNAMPRILKLNTGNKKCFNYKKAEAI